MAELRFCAYQYQHLPLVELRERWRRAEELGFDVMWNVDTVVEPDRGRHPIFDGPATLVDLALSTSSDPGGDADLEPLLPQPCDVGQGDDDGGSHVGWSSRARPGCR